jgi:hypothetical protein
VLEEVAIAERLRHLVTVTALTASLAGIGGCSRDDGAAAQPKPERAPQLDAMEHEPIVREPVRHRHERRKVAETPSLVGLTPDEVRQRLDAIGLETVFSDHCEGRPPMGRVIAQYPPPGHKPDVAHVSHGPQVTLTTDVASTCSEGRVERLCQAHDLTLEAGGSDAEYAGGGGRKWEGFQIKNRADYSCQLQTQATLTLTSLYDTDGVVSGNPATVVIDWKLQPRESFIGTWTWNSWCHKPGRWNVVVSAAGLAATGKSHTPLCMEAGSVLYPSF